MKLHRILKDFNGSQTGHDFHVFKAGTVSPLSDNLARIAVSEGWAELHEPEPLKDGPRPELRPEPAAPDELVEGTADDREMKVTEPEETKPGKVKAKKAKAA